MKVGQRVKVHSPNFGVSSLYGLQGEIVSIHDNYCKVLLDKDKGKIRDPLVLAHWFNFLELKAVKERKVSR